MSGVAVSVLLPGGGDVVWRTEGVSARLDDLQFTLGEGPSMDAAASGELVLEPDLEAVPLQRWPVFTPAALELGVRAVFAVPLQIGVIRIGVLLAQRDAPGVMDDGMLTDMLAFAGVATEALLGSAGHRVGAALAVRSAVRVPRGGTPGHRDDQRPAAGDAG